MQIEMCFPQPLSEKYRPKRIAEFVGLEKPKKIAAKLSANPYPRPGCLWDHQKRARQHWRSQSRLRCQPSYITCPPRSAPSKRYRTFAGSATHHGSPTIGGTLSSRFGG
jgi:hypothetical protein